MKYSAKNIAWTKANLENAPEIGELIDERYIVLDINGSEATDIQMDNRATFMIEMYVYDSHEQTYCELKTPRNIKAFNSIKINK